MCGPCVDRPHFASLFFHPHTLGLLSSHLEILNLVTSTRSLQPCQEIGSQVLGIWAWTLLGATVQPAPPSSYTVRPRVVGPFSLRLGVLFFPVGATTAAPSSPSAEGTCLGMRRRARRPCLPSAGCRGEGGFSDHSVSPKLGVWSFPLFQPGGRVAEAYSGSPRPLAFPYVL